MITRIFHYFQCVLNLRHRFIIGVIREFWTFSEISLTFHENLFNIAKIYFYENAGECIALWAGMKVGI